MGKIKVLLEKGHKGCGRKRGKKKKIGRGLGVLICSCQWHP